MRQAVLAASKPGVAWPDMHRLANRRILEGLKAGGFLQVLPSSDALYLPLRPLVHPDEPLDPAIMPSCCCCCCCSSSSEDGV